MLDRYANDPAASQMLTLNLINMGLIELVSDPEDPNKAMLDTRPLQVLLSRYGPRVTTASGRLGGAPGKSAIWTPGAEPSGGGSGGLWTPGADAKPAPPGGEKKLIITG
jgi:hypothetical protein